MASAKKCDRCGKLYEESILERKMNKQAAGIFYWNGISLILMENIGRKFSHKMIYDLCQECLDELDIWLCGCNTKI